LASIERIKSGGANVNNPLRRFVFLTSLVALTAVYCPLAAQQAAQPVSPGVSAGSANSQGARRTTAIAYSADQITVRTQTLADGTKITMKHLAKVYQDSAGRRRFENFANKGESEEPNDLPASISIYDPVAGVNYRLNPRDRTAEKTEMRRPTPLPVPQTTASVNPTPPRPVPPQRTREDLGTQVIEGVEAKGERFTRTIAEGAEGNDRPIQITHEIWRGAATPSIVLMMTTNDPRYGETVTRLTNLVLDEPPAELFQVPADYTVKALQPLAKPEPDSE
jgi:hypothetical protein